MLNGDLRSLEHFITSRVLLDGRSVESHDDQDVEATFVVSLKELYSLPIEFIRIFVLWC